jgi:DNA-binding response OmpR family regulator
MFILGRHMAQVVVRSGGAEAVEVSAGMTLWPEECRVVIGEETVWLTRREFAVFEVLATAAGHIVSKPEIYARVWGRRAFKPRNRSVDVFVRKVRGKLAAADGGADLIHTHHGLGYRFEPPEERP